MSGELDRRAPIRAGQRAAFEASLAAVLSGSQPSRNIATKIDAEAAAAGFSAGTRWRILRVAGVLVLAGQP